MVRLVLTFNKRIVEEFPFAKESMTIGRKSENDIFIDNLAVSGYHARIDKTGSDFILTDLQSTNGTFVNDEKVVTHKLNHADNIIIGKHRILFIVTDKEQVQGMPSEPDDLEGGKTMILDTAKQRELMTEQNKIPAVKKDEKIGVLCFLDGSSMGEVELAKKLTRIGKSDNSEVKLSGLWMGPTAATISKRPSGYTITFMGGATKLRVNGEVVQESLPLKDFDRIEIGSYKMEFYQKDVE